VATPKAYVCFVQDVVVARTAAVLPPNAVSDLMLAPMLLVFALYQALLNLGQQLCCCSACVSLRR
jgi:hypothetical protein